MNPGSLKKRRALLNRWALEDRTDDSEKALQRPFGF